jgi:cysteine synthase
VIRHPHASAVDARELPQIIRLEGELFAAAFPLMKLLPARYILDQARRSGALARDTVVVESSSGTFGLALAMLCAIERRKLILVSDPAIDEPFKRRLEDLGAWVDIVTDPGSAGGFQRARLERLAQHRERQPDHFWTCQYNNPDNGSSYARVAELLTETVGSIDCLVGTVGSGGSICGTARFLRQVFPKLYVIGVDTPGSVLFGLPDQKRVLRGLGNSVHPSNLDHTLIDEVHWVDGATAFHATRELHQRSALFRGGTSGAAALVARWWSQRHPGARVVALLPDEGERYVSTIYDDGWLAQHGLRRSGAPAGPLLAGHLEEVDPEGWSSFHWGRRTFEQVTRRPYRPDDIR